MSIGNSSTTRREFLTATALGTVSVLSGCNSSSEEDNSEWTGAEHNSPEPGPDDSSELNSWVSTLESVYEQLHRHPIVADGEFVFAVQTFENDFAHGEALETVRSIEEAIQNDESPGVPNEDIQSLSSVAKVAELLIRQRLFFHQIIIASLAFDRRLLNAEYDSATDAASDAVSFLEGLSQNGTDVEDTLVEEIPEDLKPRHYDPASISRNQTTVAEVAEWTGFACEGFYHSAAGFSALDSGNGKLQAEKFSEAGRFYGEANNRFQTAATILEEAHGRGIRLPYLVPPMEELRCIVPAYRDGSERLQKAFRELERGNEEAGREMARETLDELDQRMLRCLDS